MQDVYTEYVTHEASNGEQEGDYIKNNYKKSYEQYITWARDMMLQLPQER